MHIWERYSFLLNEIQTASLFKNCVGVIKDNRRAIIHDYILQKKRQDFPKGIDKIRII